MPYPTVPRFSLPEQAGMIWPVPPEQDYATLLAEAQALAQQAFPPPPERPFGLGDALSAGFSQPAPVMPGAGGGANFLSGFRSGFAGAGAAREKRRLLSEQEIAEHREKVRGAASTLAGKRWEDYRKSRESALEGQRKFLGGQVEGDLAAGRQTERDAATEQRAMAREQREEQRRLAAEKRANSEAERRLRLQASLRPKPSAATRPATAGERQSMAFYLRANDAISSLTSSGPNGEPSLENKIGKSPVGQAQINWLPNVFKPADAQSYTQAQRAFTEARLRKESGAAIAEHEYKNDARIYFAQPGDKPSVIDQKRQKRQRVLDGLKFSAGKAYREYFEGPEQQPASDGMDDEAAFDIARQEGWIK